ncbi:MAG: ADP-ribosylglycohydrolase family protein [Pseudomonadota bacterium]
MSVYEDAESALLPGTYWVESTRLLAGEYPGDPDPYHAEQRVRSLLGLGIDYFLDLTWPDELPPYDAWLPSPYARGVERPVVYSRRPIRDHGLPRDPLQMVEILDELDEALAGQHRVYVHCRAGIGRTGTVIGCHLARRLGSGSAALAALDQLWRSAGRTRAWPRTPETDEQVGYVRDWREARGELAPPGGTPHDNPGAPASGAPLPALPGEAPLAPVSAADRLQDRYRGQLFGLAIGDALGMPVQLRRPGTFTPIGDLIGGGPFDLPRGAWTDDTALALVLADSLVERQAFDARDQVQRYQRWQRDGYRSSTGQCIGISATTARALAQAQWSGNPFAGPHDPAKAEKEPLVRAGIAAAWALAEPEKAVALGAEAARITHQAPIALDACRFYAALVVGALRGDARERLLQPDYAPVPGLGERRPLRREVAALVAGGWRRAVADGKPPGGPTAVDGLTVVLWALEQGAAFRPAVLAAVNLGGDADTYGALVGQLAGALYGYASLPPHWRSGVARADLLAATADTLLAGTLDRIANG